MADNKLLLCPVGTEFLLLGTPLQHQKFNFLHFLLMNLTFTDMMSLTVILVLPLTSIYHLTSISMLVYGSVHYLIHDLNQSGIYGSSFWYTRSTCQCYGILSPRLLQFFTCRILPSPPFKAFKRYRTLALAITKTPKYDLVTESLHWLPIRQQIDLKTCLKVCIVLHSNKPSYLHILLTVQYHKHWLFWLAFLHYRSLSPQWHALSNIVQSIYRLIIISSSTISNRSAKHHGYIIITHWNYCQRSLHVLYLKS